MAEKRISRFRRLTAGAKAVLNDAHFFSHNEAELHWLQKFAHFWVLVIKSFWSNRCPIRASALAYTTLLALVPLLAVGISISTSLLKREGGKQQIQELINTLVAKVAPQLNLVSKAAPGESGTQKVAENISSYINTVSSGALGATAIIALVFVAISLLSTIEATVNDIWGVAQGRSWFARVVQYWALITMGPIFLLVALAPNVGSSFEATNQFLKATPVLGLIYKVVPLFMLVMAFAGFYQLMPNTKVNWRAALVGGIVGGGLWHLNNVFSVVYFGQVVRDSQIYGKLAIVPVFLVGIYFSWLIVLFGAQVAYAFQNRRAYIQERQTENVNERGLEFVALRLMTYIAQKFYRGEPPPTRSESAEALSIPGQLVGKVTGPLVKTNLILEVATEVQNEMALAPARPLDQISYQDILDAIRAGQGQELETRAEPSCDLVRTKFKEIQAAERRVAGTVTLHEMAQSSARFPLEDSAEVKDGRGADAAKVAQAHAT